MDSEDNQIVNEHQLGLLLYRGGTVCNHRWNKGFGSKAANAICMEMNFKGADRWTTKESFDIQYGKNISVGYVECSSAEWGSCSYSEDTQNCYHSQDVFLSCRIRGLEKVQLAFVERWEIFLIYFMDFLPIKSLLKII